MSEGLCTSCGAAVNLAAGQDEIKCTYCGSLVKRPEAEAQFVELKNSKVGGTLILAEMARESGNNQAAFGYYNKAIEIDPCCAEAWFYKAVCGLYRKYCEDGTTYLNFPHISGDDVERLTKEAVSSWKAAIRFAKQPEAMKKRVASEISNIVLTKENTEHIGSGIREANLKVSLSQTHYYRLAISPFDIKLVVQEILSISLAIQFALELNPLPKNITAILEMGYVICDKRFVHNKLNDAWHEPISFSDFSRYFKISCSELEVEKAKYEQLLAKYDPAFLKNVEAETVQEKEQEANQVQKQTTNNQSAVGWLMYGCGVLSATFIIGAIVKISNGGQFMEPGPSIYSEKEMGTVGYIIIGGVVLTIITGYLFFCRKSPELSAKVVDKVKSTVTDGVTLVGGLVLHEMSKKERNKPLTKGDLEDLKAEQRRKERGY